MRCQWRRDQVQWIDTSYVGLGIEENLLSAVEPRYASNSEKLVARSCELFRASCSYVSFCKVYTHQDRPG